MLRNITNLFYKKKKTIEDEIAIKSKIDEALSDFVKKEILKNANIDYQLSFSFSKGIIKLETDNKLIAQEVALRIRLLEANLRDKGVKFNKLLV